MGTYFHIFIQSQANDGTGKKTSPQLLFCQRIGYGLEQYIREVTALPWMLDDENDEAGYQVLTEELLEKARNVLRDEILDNERRLSLKYKLLPPKERTEEFFALYEEEQELSRLKGLDSQFDMLINIVETIKYDEKNTVRLLASLG